MAAFKDWALQYVLAEDDAVLSDIAHKAATEIETSRASSAAVGSWASSIQEWMKSTNTSSDDLAEDGDEASGSGNVIARAKALGFLAATLKALDKTTLKADQVQRLGAFFGSMFANDHKAGITAAAKALHQLTAAKNFKPELGVKMIKDVCQIKEDFRLQTAPTRLEVYELFITLIQDPAVASELQHEHGASSGFILDLLHLCGHERDPKNLMVWFKIITILLVDYSPSDDVTAEIFKTFSNYFPISMRSSATSVGVTADDLKLALRACFSAHQRLAPLAFPYLVQRLDQGDSITASVKTDILKTMKACIEQYQKPQSSLVPYIDKIWSSLKYEVRNGEVRESIDATLDVLRAIGAKLDDSESVKNYVDLVFSDSLEDLSNPTYTKQAGLLCITVVASSTRAFVTEGAKLVDSIKQNLRQPKSPMHTRDLLALLNTTLKERTHLFGPGAHVSQEDLQVILEDSDVSQAHSQENAELKDQSLDQGKDASIVRTLFHEVYLKLWKESSSDEAGEQTTIKKEVVKGLPLLALQCGFLPSGDQVSVFTYPEALEMVSLLLHQILNKLVLSSNDASASDPEMETEMVMALRSMAMHSGSIASHILSKARSAILARDWKSPSDHSLSALKELMARLAYITCSELPWSGAHFDGPASHKIGPFVTMASVMVQTLESLLGTGADPAALTLVLSGIHAAMLNFRDACAPLPQDVQIQSDSDSSGEPINWQKVFSGAMASTTTLPVASEVQWLDLLPRSSTGQDSPVFAEFTQLSLHIVKSLYGRMTTEVLQAKPDGEGTHTVVRLMDDLAGYEEDWLSLEPVMYQLASIASLAIKPLDAASQRSLNLHVEAFRLFNVHEVDAKDPYVHTSDGPLLDILRAGILESLWPEAMVDLYANDGIAKNVVWHYLLFLDRRWDISAGSTAMATILANKFKPAADPSRRFYKDVLWFIQSHFQAPPADHDGDLSAFAEQMRGVVSLLSGGIARQDRELTTVMPLLHETIGHKDAHVGMIAAKALEGLVREKSYLRHDTHAIIRPLFKQWAYANFVKPMFPMASPVSQEVPQAQNYSIAILSVLKHCPFAVYEDDVQDIVRMLMKVLSEIRPGNASETQAALQVLREILSNDHEALKDHLTAVVDNIMKVVERPSDGSGKFAVPGACRKVGIEILAELPTKFEERYLLRYSLRVTRLLVEACGDPVREVRRKAIVARENWAKVV